MRLEIIRVEVQGQKWSGTFQVEGDEVSVASAYGWTQAKLARRAPEVVARKLLVDQIEAWAKRRGLAVKRAAQEASPGEGLETLSARARAILSRAI